MVNPLDFIPKLSGFSPMPLGIMAPFMAYQSAALAYNFGLNYEFGKRVIKSMSNEKFNAIANDPIKLNELTAKHHDVLLKAFINEVPKVEPIQKLILDQMVKLEFEKIKIMPQLIAQIPSGFIEGLFNLNNTGNVENVPQPDTGTKRPPSLCKFQHPYTYCGELFHVPQVGSLSQYHLAGETTAIEHLQVKGFVRFYEFNPDFNFARA